MAEDYQDPTTIDVDEVRANINNSWRLRRQHWTADPSWPNVTVKAMANRIETLESEREQYRRRLEFLEILADGGPLKVNGIPWREAFDRLNAIVSDPLPDHADKTSSGDAS